MNVGTELLGNQDNTSSEKPAMQNSGSRLMLTSSLLDYGFKPQQRANGPPTTPICTACRLPFAVGEKRHKHHVSYRHDWTVPVHISCHKYIDNSNRYPHLKPAASETRKYYKQRDRYRQTNKNKIKKTLSQWYQANKDKVRERGIPYREANRNKIRQYRLDNKDKIREQNRQYWLANKDKERERNRQYRLDNKDKIREQNRQYWLANKDKINERHRRPYQQGQKKGQGDKTGCGLADCHHCSGAILCPWNHRQATQSQNSPEWT